MVNLFISITLGHLHCQGVCTPSTNVVVAFITNKKKKKKEKKKEKVRIRLDKVFELRVRKRKCGWTDVGHVNLIGGFHPQTQDTSI